MKKAEEFAGEKVYGYRSSASSVTFYLTIIAMGISLAVSSFGEISDSNLSPPKSPWDYKNTKLTGDWGGERTKLAEKGITLDIASFQTLQGVGGGTRQQWKYGGSFEYNLKLDFGKMGLWPGAFLEIGAEDQFGQFINKNTGAILPENTLGVFPEPDQQELYLDRVVFTQFFSETFGLYFGKLTTITETTGDWNPLAGGKGHNQFMNLAFVANPAMLTAIPYSTLGGGAIFLFPGLGPSEKEPATFNVAIMGPDGRAGQWPWEDFDSGTIVAGEFSLPTRFFNKPGGQLLGAAYSSKDFTGVSQDPRFILGDILRDLPPNLEKHQGTSALFYNFYQYIVSDEKDPRKGWGVFGRYGLGDKTTNTVSNFYSLGIGGKGVLSRDNDTWGIGYFYIDLSDNFNKILQNRFRNMQGFEMFYNIEVTPCLHITPDFQIIDPSNKDANIAYVAGFRVRMDF